MSVTVSLTPEQAKEAGIKNILALRGDPMMGDIQWQPHPGKC